LIEPTVTGRRTHSIIRSARGYGHDHREDPYMSSYMKAEETLPPELLIEIQKYVQGTLIYIPRLPDEKLGWGHKNGTRQVLDQRDDAIRAAKALGNTIEQLADEYALSADAIRKILYRRKPGVRMAGCTLDRTGAAPSLAGERPPASERKLDRAAS
jgi:hypothetical protein